MASRAVIRDAGRVLELPYTFCDQLSKPVPEAQNKPLSLKDARNAEPLLARREKKKKKSLIYYDSTTLRGPRSKCWYACGGVLIAPGELTDFCSSIQSSRD